MVKIMALTERTAPSRNQYPFAKITQLLSPLKWISRRVRRPTQPSAAQLSDRYLRDIGLTSADFAAERHSYPSQTLHHPRG